MYTISMGIVSIYIYIYYINEIIIQKDKDLIKEDLQRPTKLVPTLTTHKRN